jgi:hypothetical protein
MEVEVVAILAMIGGHHDRDGHGHISGTEMAVSVMVISEDRVSGDHISGRRIGDDHRDWWLS